MSVGRLSPSANCMALYHLENTNDDSGNARTLTNHGASFVTAKIGVGASVESGTYLSRADNAGIDPSESNTLMFKIKFSVFGNDSYLVTLYHQYWYYIKIFYDNGLKASIQYSSGNSGSLPNPFTLGKWYRVALTYNSTGRIVTFYVGGVPITTFTGGTQTIGTSTFSIWGAESDGSAIIDEVVLYQELKSAQWIRRYNAWATGKL